MTTYPPGMKVRPLDGWPIAHTPHHKRKASPFEARLSSTIELLTRELRAFGPNGLNSVGGLYHYPQSILQIALRERDFRNDGMPRANADPEHPGIILTVEPKDRPSLSFPCDTFTHWHDNLRAVALTLEALRKIDRYGVTQTGQQYRGWQAIEAKPSIDAIGAACVLIARIAWPNENAEHQAAWAPQIATIESTGRNSIRQARARAHPDRHGGDQSCWNQLESAITVLRNSGVEWAR